MTKENSNIEGKYFNAIYLDLKIERGEDDLKLTVIAQDRYTHQTPGDHELVLHLQLEHLDSLISRLPDLRNELARRREQRRQAESEHETPDNT